MSQILLLPTYLMDFHIFIESKKHRFSFSSSIFECQMKCLDNKELVLNEKASKTLAASGANVIKLFLPVIYRFSFSARVFVRLG